MFFPFHPASFSHSPAFLCMSPASVAPSFSFESPRISLPLSIDTHSAAYLPTFTSPINKQKMPFIMHMSPAPFNFSNSDAAEALLSLSQPIHLVPPNRGNEARTDINSFGTEMFSQLCCRSKTYVVNMDIGSHPGIDALDPVVQSPPCCSHRPPNPLIVLYAALFVTPPPDAPCCGEQSDRATPEASLSDW